MYESQLIKHVIYAVLDCMCEEELIQFLVLKYF